MSKKLVVVIAVLALLLVACGGSGRPTEYNATVQNNFLEGCVEGLEKDFSITAVRSVCSCFYNGVEDSIEFEDFDMLNERLLEDINALTQTDSNDATLNQARDILKDCIVDCKDNFSSSSCQPIREFFGAAA